MSENNLERCLRATDLIEDYVAAGHGDPEDTRATIVDMLADLCHAASDLSYDPSELFASALMHFKAERGSV